MECYNQFKKHKNIDVPKYQLFFTVEIYFAAFRKIPPYLSNLDFYAYEKTSKCLKTIKALRVPIIILSLLIGFCIVGILMCVIFKVN